MTDTAPTPTRHASPLGQAAEEQGIVLTQMLIVADVERSARFYRDVLGAVVLRERAPAMLSFHNGSPRRSTTTAPSFAATSATPTAI